MPVALACVALVEYSARMKVFPACFANRNSTGTAYWSLVLVMGIAIVICATGATFGVVMTIFSFVNTLSEIPNTPLSDFRPPQVPQNLRQFPGQDALTRSPSCWPS